MVPADSENAVPDSVAMVEIVEYKKVSVALAPIITELNETVLNDDIDAYSVDQLDVVPEMLLVVIVRINPFIADTVLNVEFVANNDDQLDVVPRTYDVVSVRTAPPAAFKSLNDDSVAISAVHVDAPPRT